MEKYRLPYKDPGQRKPWVPYHQWKAEREAERLRVPGVFRNDRARKARKTRQGVRMPEYSRIMPAYHRDPQNRRNYELERKEWVGARARGIEPGLHPEVIEERRIDVANRNAVRQRMHTRAREIWEETGEVPDYDYDPEALYEAEQIFDREFGNYAGRYEEYAPKVEDVPVEKKVRFEED